MNIKTVKISGKIVKGDQYGRKLGFPTANLDRRSFSRQETKIKLGVYGGWAEFRLKAKSYKLKAAVVIGPLDKKGLPKIEAHLLNFKGNLYGIYLNIYLNIYLRPFKKFKGEAELKRQIKEDIKLIKSLNIKM
ncbi:MAG: riboflavin kinase [Patescibacteria group bacterium]|nr:riboflavin kinase [Patescibacteria group bacterium]